MDILITNIGQLITPVESALGEGVYTLQVTQDTTLCIQNGRIVDELKSSRGREVVQTLDAGGGVVMPGLIDPFWVMPHVPAWIAELPESKPLRRDLLSWSRRLFQQALRSGVTTIEVKCPHEPDFACLSALGHLSRHDHPRVVGALLASLPVSGAKRDRSMSSLIGEVIPEIRRRRLATFCDMGWDRQDASIAELGAVLRAASGAGLRPKLHIQTSDQINDVCELALSLEVAAIGCASHLPSDAAKQLSDADVVPIYLPELNAQTGQHLNVRPLVDQGMAIGIGSGNGLTASPPKSMWTVLAAGKDRMNMSLDEAIVACTLGNAIALEMPHELGTLEAGKQADLIILDLVDYRELETALMPLPVTMVLVNGEPVHSL